MLGRNFGIRRRSIVAAVARFPSMETRGARRNGSIKLTVVIYIYRRRVANKFLVSGARLKRIVGRVTRLDILNACFPYP